MQGPRRAPEDRENGGGHRFFYATFVPEGYIDAGYRRDITNNPLYTIIRLRHRSHSNKGPRVSRSRQPINRAASSIMIDEPYSLAFDTPAEADIEAFIPGGASRISESSQLT